MKPVGELLGLSARYLQERGVEAPRLTAELLLAGVLAMKRIDLYMQFDYPVEERELAVFRSRLKRAGLHEPVEYILRETEFYGCVLSLSQDVLIPRPETEVGLDLVVKLLRRQPLSGAVFWDVCTGSGCAGIAVKKALPELEVTISDVSEGALAVATLNAKKNGVSVRSLLGDLLVPFAGERAHFLFCNPPYISRKEYESLAPSVRLYEPEQALVGGEDGLDFYRRLAEVLPRHLFQGGRVFLEIGAGRGREVEQIFSSPVWRKKELFPDYAGHDRFFFLEME